jgi:hypothetical protein
VSWSCSRTLSRRSAQERLLVAEPTASFRAWFALLLVAFYRSSARSATATPTAAKPRLPAGRAPVVALASSAATRSLWLRASTSYTPERST